MQGKKCRGAGRNCLQTFIFSFSNFKMSLGKLCSLAQAQAHLNCTGGLFKAVFPSDSSICARGFEVLAQKKMAEEYNEGEVEEEFSVWKKNTPLLYDLFISQPLQWPSLTVHWLPSSPQSHFHPSFNIHKLLLATHTAQGDPNFLMLADASLPIDTSQPIVATDPDHLVLPKVCFFSDPSFCTVTLWAPTVRWNFSVLLLVVFCR